MRVFSWCCALTVSALLAVTGCAFGCGDDDDDSGGTSSSGGASSSGGSCSSGGTVTLEEFITQWHLAQCALDERCADIRGSWYSSVAACEAAAQDPNNGYRRQLRREFNLADAQAGLSCVAALGFVSCDAKDIDIPDCGRALEYKNPVPEGAACTASGWTATSPRCSTQGYSGHCPAWTPTSRNNSPPASARPSSRTARPALTSISA